MRLLVGLVLVWVIIGGLVDRAEAQAPPDIVRLRDGSFVRGTIIEQTPAEVTVMMPTGETRVIPAAAVAYAGPDVSTVRPPPVAAPAPVGPPMARLHVTADPDDGYLSLQRLSGTATVSVWTGRGTGSATIDSFEVLCTAPCDVEIPEGTYQLGVGHNGSSAQRTSGPTRLRGSMSLHIDYESREAIRIAGWLTFVFGNLLGGGLTFASILIDDRGGIDVPMLVSGAVIWGISYIVWCVMAFMNDHAEVIPSEGLRF